jgi:hypothetical protein
LPLLRLIMKRKISYSYTWYTQRGVYAQGTSWPEYILRTVDKENKQYDRSHSPGSALRNVQKAV